MSEKLSLSLLLRRFDKRTLVGHFDKLQEPLNKYFRRYASKTLIRPSFSLSLRFEKLIS